MSTALLLVMLLAAEPEPAPGPSSQPTQGVAEQLGFIERPIVFDDERERLTREYRAARYGQVGVTSRIDPHGLVVHFTGAATLDASLALYRAPRVDPQLHPRLAARSPLGSSVHFVVDPEGDIYQLMPLNQMARHAGPLNTTALGVALVGSREADITSSQRVALSDLAAADIYGTPTPFLVGHHDIERLRRSAYWRDPADAPLVLPSVPGDFFMQDTPHVDNALADHDLGSDFLYDRSWLEQRTLKRLILLRNGIFARWGRAFPARDWVQAHFDSQPGYELDDAFTAAALTRLDQENVRLIADVERSFTRAQLVRRRGQTKDPLEQALLDERRTKNAVLSALARWKPGRKLSPRLIKSVDRDELFAFYVRMSVALKLGGMYGDCFDAAAQTGVRGVCEAWENNTRKRGSLGAADRRILRIVEHRLAFFVVEKRYALQDELGGCRRDCGVPWELPGPDGAPVVREPNAAERKACEADCTLELGEFAADVARDKRDELRDLKKGRHSKGGDLVNELLYGDLDGFG